MSYNIQNLIPINTRPPEEHRALSSKGGKASGEARRAKAAARKAMQERAEQYLMAHGLAIDIAEFKRWKAARARRERTKEATKK